MSRVVRYMFLDPRDLTAEEFWTLWSERLIYSDGSLPPGVHFGRTAMRLGQLRGTA